MSSAVGFISRLWALPTTSHHVESPTLLPCQMGTVTHCPVSIPAACGQSDSKFYNATTWNIAQSLNPTVFGPPGKNHCPTVQPDLGGFCWPNGQPDFSAVRTSAFGYGTLDILNATHAEWAFYRNHDAPWFSLDKVMLDRSRPKSCASPSHVAGRR